MGGGGGGDVPANTTSVTTSHLAPYIEAAHQAIINTSSGQLVTALAADNPYEVDDLDFDDAFFGAGYALTSFPALYDMFGKFMAGLDIDVLFTQIFNDTVNSTVISDAVSAQAEMLSDDIEEDVLPRFEAGMRDINSVVASTFVVGRSLIEAKRLKDISSYEAGLRVGAMPLATERHAKHLEWNKSVVMAHAEFLKFYILHKTELDDREMEIDAKKILWPFTVLSNHANIVSATTPGAGTSSTTTSGGASKSGTAQALGNTVAGAGLGYMAGNAGLMGASVGGPWGAVIGGAVGLAMSLF